MSKDQKDDSTTRLIYIIAVVLFLLFILASLQGIKYFWGFNFLKYHQVYWSYLAIAIVLLLFVPNFNKIISQWLSSFSGYLNKRTKRLIIFQVVLTAGLLALFLSFPSNTTLLGDGTLRKNQILNGTFWLGTEPLDFFIHAVFWKYVFEPLGFKVLYTYYVISAVCGIFFIDGIIRLARYLDAKNWLMYVLAMLSSGIIVLFFGYVESYSILAALLPYIVLAGLKVADGISSPWVFIVWFLVLGIVHTVAFFIFPGALIIVLLFRREADFDHLKRYSYYLLGITLAGLVIAYILKYAGVTFVDRYLLSFLPREDYRQGIFTLNYWLNLLNWFFLSGSPFLVLLPVLFFHNRGKTPSEVKRFFLALWLIIASGIFVIFFTPRLGGPRDWDLFGIPVFVCLLSVLIIYPINLKKKLPAVMVPLAAMSFIVTGMFVSVNRVPVLAADHFEEIIEVSQFKNPVKDYMHLASYSELYPELRQRSLDYLFKVWQATPYSHVDSVATLNKISSRFIERRAKTEAWRYLRLSMSLDSLNFDTHLILLKFAEVFGGSEDQIHVAKLFEQHFPGEPQALMNAGVVYFYNGDKDRGSALLQEAYRLDSTDVMILMNNASILIDEGEYTRALQLCQRAKEGGLDNFVVNLNSFLALRGMGEMTRAKEFLKLAYEKAKSPGDRDLALKHLRALKVPGY